MKKIFFFFLIVIGGEKIMAQNIGIGTSTPTALLDVNGSVHLRHADSTAGFWLQGNAGTNRSFWGVMDENTLGIFGNGGAGWAFTINMQNKHTGIGTQNPGASLDVNGRVRLRRAGGFNAGFSLVGTSSNYRSFFGLIDDNHLGIYSSTTATWHTAMNVINGNMGFGTAVPTARLDVNGTMMLRGGSPKKGCILLSSDANGNMMWQPPVGFITNGLNSLLSTHVNQWKTIPYSINQVAYDEGNVYSNDYRFTAPYDGFYELTIQLGMYSDYYADATDIRIMLVRNGSHTELMRYDVNQVYNTILNTNTNPISLFKDPNRIELIYNTGGLILNANDSLYAQMYIDGNAWTHIGGNFTTNGGAPLEYDACKFTGHLIRRL